VLPGDLISVGARLDQVNDLVVLQGQRSCDRSGLLPAEDVVDPDALSLDELPMRIMIRRWRAAEMRVVIASKAI
jgi:hypothetical protein